MLRGLQTAATGMDAQQTMIDVLSNNIANANTNAFKSSRPHFHDLIYQTIRAPGLQTREDAFLPSGFQLGNGVATASVDKNFQQGSVKITNVPTDLMINGSGFFQILLPDGDTAYTRDGAFKLSSDGHLVTSQGFSLNPPIQIPADADAFHIGEDGTVSARVPNDVEPQVLGQILITQFLNPTGLSGSGHNFYKATEASGDPQVRVPGELNVGRLSQGQLETSNVNTVESMVQMIMAQRAYEMNSKVVSSCDQALATANQMKG
jgi:flagellar basal-body rod protein FlgG